MSIARFAAATIVVACMLTTAAHGADPAGKCESAETSGVSTALGGMIAAVTECHGISRFVTRNVKRFDVG